MQKPLAERPQSRLGLKYSTAVLDAYGVGRVAAGYGPTSDRLAVLPPILAAAGPRRAGNVLISISSAMTGFLIGNRPK